MVEIFLKSPNVLLNSFFLQNLAIQNGEHGALVQQILDTQKELEVDNAESAAKRPGKQYFCLKNLINFLFNILVFCFQNCSYLL